MSSDTHSALGAPGVLVTQKPSFGDTLVSIDDFVAKYKLTSTLAHITSLIKAKTNAERLAFLVAIGENYQNAGLLNNAEALLKVFPNIEALLLLATKAATYVESGSDADSDTTSSVFDLFAQQARDFTNQADFSVMFDGKENVMFNPLAPIEEQPQPARDYLKMLEEFTPMIRPLLGLAAFFACAFGFDQLLSMQWLSTTSKSVVALAATIRAKKVIKEEIEEGIDSLLSLVYESFGGIYVPEKLRKLKELNTKICKLFEITNRYCDLAKTDAFGVLRCETIPSLIAMEKEYTIALSHFQENEKSNFNFRDMMSDIRQNIRVLRERRNALIKGAGKQEPIKIWLTGRPGVGKSELASRIANALTGGRSVYTRNAQDKYYSTYVGQTCIIFDDIMQDPQSGDVGEWMAFATTAAKDVPMAELENKGTPFTSRYMIATSNRSHLVSHPNVTSIEAFNRRRDYLVHVSNRAVDLYKDENNGEEPPREWYAEHPTRFFLYNPTLSCTINTDAPGHGTEGFIGEVTEEELVCMAKEAELEKAEHFRKHLAASEVKDILKIPEPFQYDIRRFMTSIIFDKVTKTKRYSPLHPPNDVNTEVAAPSEASVITIASSSEEVQNHGKLTPVSTLVNVRNKAIVIFGPPGIGKTRVVEEILTTLHNIVRVTDNMIRTDPNWINTIQSAGAVIFVDDFTTTSTLCEAMRTLCVENDAGRLNAALLIGTGNSDTPQWKGDVVGQITRRSHFCEIGVPFKTWASLRFTGKTLESFLVDKRESIVTMKHEGKTHTYLQIVPVLQSLFQEVSSQDVQIMYEAFHLPYVTTYDIFVSMPLNWAQTTHTSAMEVYSLVREARICKRVNDTFEDMSQGEKFAYLLKLSPLFVSQAFGNIDTFVTIFNREKHQSTITEHIMVVFEDGIHLGFIPTDTQIVAYIPDLDDALQVTIHENKIFSCNSEQHYTEINAPYRQALLRTLGHETSQLQVSAPTDAVVTRDILKQTALGTFAYALIPALSLGVKFGAALTLLGSMYERSGTKKDQKDVVEERKKTVRTKCTEDVLPSDQERNDRSMKANNIRCERKAIQKRRKPVDAYQPPSDEEHNDNLNKRNHVHERRRNVGKKTAVAHDINSDEERNDNAHPKNAVKVEGTPCMPESVYEGPDKSRKSQTQVKVNLESRDSEGLLVVNDGNYGFCYGGHIIYANEVPENVFTITMVPITNSWELVDVASLPRTCRVKTKQFNIQFYRKQLDENAIRSAIGEVFAFSASTACDFSSIFAFAHVFGIPYEIEANEIRAELVPRIFNENTRTRAPQPLINYMSKVFPAIIMPKQEICQEGMYDPQIKNAIEIGLKASCVLETDQGHCVFGVLIGQNKILTVGHVQKLKLKMKDHNGKRWPVKLACVNARCDLAMFTVDDRTFPAAQDISHIFVKSEDLRRILAVNLKAMPGCLVIPPHEGSQYANVSHCAITPQVACDGLKELNGRTLSYSATLNGMTVTGLTVEGDCGSQLFLQNKTLTGKLCGIHRAGNSTMSLSSLVTQEWVKKMLISPEALDSEDVKEESGLQAIKVPPEITLRQNAVTCNRTDLLWVGTVNNPAYTPDTTRIHRTGILIQEYDDFEPSLMSTLDPRCGDYQPLNEGLKRYGTEATPYTPDRLEVEEAFLQIGNEISNKILSQGQDVRILTKTEAINIPPFEEYPNARSIDRSGSAGFPHNLSRAHGTSKGDSLYFKDSTQRWYFKPDPVSQKISSKIDCIIDDAKQGIEHLHPFTAYLKDESLKKAKIYDVRKTRLFFSGSFEYLIAFRRYFLSSMLRVMGMYSQIPCKVGISSKFHDWHTMATQLAKVSSFGFASDVSNFDSSVPKVFLEESVKVFNTIYERCSAPGENIAEGNTVRNVLHRAIEGPYVLSRKSLFKLMQAQVSGNPATAVENSFIMWALYYLVWKRLALEHDASMASYRSFRNKVALAVYGDDNVCTVSPDCPWFNFNNFKKEALKFGFKITDAAKKGGDVPDFQPLEELEFLKRQFVKDQGLWKGPLALKSIAKSVMWVREGSYRITKDHVPSFDGAWPIAQNKDIITSSIEGMFPELSLHGREIYASWRDDILKQASSLDLIIDAPLYEDALAKMGYNMY